MEFKGTSEERAAAPARESMATSNPKRSNRLHNFTLPSTLKWGSQKHLRCTKSATSGNNLSGGASMIKRPQIDGGENDMDDEGIDAVREKLVQELKDAADKMKDVLLGNSKDVEEEEKDEEGVKPWNRRTRREEFKARVGARGSGKGLKIEEKKPNYSSSIRGNDNGKTAAAKLMNLRSNSGKTVPKLKFSVELTKKEIEEDFIAMTGRKPPKKPMKRPKAVQKQVDVSFIYF